VARPARLELATLCLEGRRSIQLSYGRAVILILRHLRLVLTVFWSRLSAPPRNRKGACVLKFAARNSLTKVGSARIGDASIQSLFPNRGVFCRVRCVHEINREDALQFVVARVPAAHARRERLRFILFVSPFTPKDLM
jgi:hypothetical protein